MYGEEAMKTDVDLLGLRWQVVNMASSQADNRLGY
jgi:hypothetical protein